MKKIIIIIAILFSQTALSAQSSKIEYADRAFEKHYYTTAIQLYAKVLAKQKKNKQAQTKIAECYWRTNNWHEAEYWYGQLVHSLRDPKPEFMLKYALALQINNKCEEAKAWFERYAIAKPKDPRGKLFAAACQIDNLEALLEDKLDLYEIERLALNSETDDFNGKLTPDGNFLFTKGNIGVAYDWYVPVYEPFILENYQVKLTPAIFATTEQPVSFAYAKNLRNMKTIAPNDRHGCISYSFEEQQIYFMQYDKKECGVNIPNLIPFKAYSAQRQRSQWGYHLPFEYNSDDYTVVHPTLSKDGTKVYFASDLPGGYGGMDLYYAEYEDGMWTTPVNMGDSINTKGDEVFPFVHYETGEFYFSSNGWGGLGGFDIYKAVPRKKNTWYPPQNLGAPINSQENDYSFYCTNDQQLGFFASDRKGGAGGTDIYSFKKVGK